MKNEIRLALLCLAAASAPAFAQNSLPQCGSGNFDQTRNAFTVVNADSAAVNQQCLITVYPAGALPGNAWQSPGSYIPEGSYTIEMSGGGGGGGGASKDAGGGGGGGGASPTRVVQYLSPGVYKMTLGTGGRGGSANGGMTEFGNPSSLTNADTGQLVAGIQGADLAQLRSRGPDAGRGGAATLGGSAGGAGGDSGPRKEEAAQAGGTAAGQAGMAGQAGVESGRTGATISTRAVQSNAGGGGGGSVGSGGAGQSIDSNLAAGTGNLGAGGGGGRGGVGTAEGGGTGGHGFIRLSMSQPAVAPVPAPAPAVVALAPVVMQKYSLSADALFAFGKSTLSSSGEAKLDELVARLRNVNIDSITDTGHADRIGSSELNQKLSLSRAESVQTYLVSKGLQSNRFSTSGRGETQPVKKLEECSGPLNAKLIACLQPDRRVDIEVVGSNKVVSMN